MIINIGTDNAAINYATMDFADDMTRYAATSDQVLANIDNALDGAVDNTQDLTWTSLDHDASKNVAAVVILKYITSDALSPLIGVLEFTSPVVPNGGNIVVAFDGSGLFTF